MFTILFSACSGSDTYRGAWKAKDTEGKKFEIVFDAKKFDVKDSSGHLKSYMYSQKSVSISNSIKTYGIQLEDGRFYSIHFPMADNDSLAVIKDDNNRIFYTIGRQRYVNYEDIYTLQ
jgi:hypothetical protein